MSGADQSAEGVAQLWSRPQYAVAYQEARAVLNAQQQRKSNLDDKALRTTRLTAVVVGALITAVNVFGVTVVQPTGLVGVGLLVVSFGTGLAAYGGAGPSLGPGASDLRQLLTMNDEQWERRFLAQMSRWVALGTKRLDRSSLLLAVSEITLFAGIVATLSAIVI
jgi:hypothetical protein